MTTFASGAATDVGQVRQVNQDNVLIADDVFAVADGMGGHRGGEVASLVAIEALQLSFQERTTDALVDAVQSANAAIVERAKGDPDLRGMGTTMCALARVRLDDGEECLTIVNVGDSRAYLLKGGESELIQISEDHSLVQTLVRQGQLTQAEAAVHPQRNILTRALGIDQKVLPDSFDLLPVKGDRYLLCSDGLFNEVEETTIAEVLLTNADPQAASVELVRLANEGGGRDNISVVVVDIIDDAGHHKLLEARSDEHRVVQVVHGADRAASAVPGTTDPGANGSAPGAGTVIIGAPAVPSPGAPAPLPPSPALTAPVLAATKSRFTWRVALFLMLFLGVFGVAAFAVNWMGTNSYYVGLDNGEVVIFQGRPGGFLWYTSSVAERTNISAADVPAELQADVAKGKTEPSLQEARDYVARLKTGVVAPPGTTTGTSQPATGTSRPAGTSSTALPTAVAGNILGEAVTGGPLPPTSSSSTTTTTSP